MHVQPIVFFWGGGCLASPGVCSFFSFRVLSFGRTIRTRGLNPNVSPRTNDFPSTLIRIPANSPPIPTKCESALHRPQFLVYTLPFPVYTLPSSSHPRKPPTLLPAYMPSFGACRRSPNPSFRGSAPKTYTPFLNHPTYAPSLPSYLSDKTKTKNPLPDH